MVKNLPEMQVQSLGQEDPLEKGMATTPVILLGMFAEKVRPSKSADFLIMIITKQLLCANICPVVLTTTLQVWYDVSFYRRET